MRLILAVIIIVALAAAGWWLVNQPSAPVTIQNTFNMGLTLTSSAWADGQAIPPTYTCDGEDMSPPLKIGNLPTGTKSLALVVDDPDAPAGSFIHWLVWNIRPNEGEIMEGKIPSRASAGTNSFGRVGYGGPCPPDRTVVRAGPPEGEHRYLFKLIALDTELDLPVSTTIKEFNQAVAGHIIEETILTGTYRRSD